MDPAGSHPGWILLNTALVRTLLSKDVRLQRVVPPKRL